MANMHVLTQSGGKYRVVLHIAIPASLNSAGISWRTVLVNSGLGGKTILPDGNGTGGTIDTVTEKPSVQNGSVFEEVVDWDVTRNGQLSGAAILSFMDALYALRSAETLQRLQVQLAHFGRVQP